MIDGFSGPTEKGHTIMPQGPFPENRIKTGVTANSVKAVRPKEKPYKLSDRDGLYLLVQPNGNRFWRMNNRFHGKQKTMSFGRWPEVMLADAREKPLAARRLLADKIDPMEQAKLDAIQASIAQEQTFKAI